MTAPVIPTSSAELVEILADKKRMDPIYADPAQFVQFLNNYAAATNKPANGDVQRLVDEGIQAGLAAFAKNTKTDIRRPDQTPATAADVQRLKATGAAYNKKAMGAALDGEFTDLADYYATINHRADRTDPTVRDRITKLKNALSSTVPSEGGFLIPEEFRAELLRVALETAIVRPRARVIPMASLRIALPMLDSTTNASSVFGGVIAYWTEESATLTASSPTFGKVVLDAKKLTAYSDLPNELGDDSAISLDAFVGEAFPQALAWYEDKAFLLGTGVGEPLGALNTANSAMVAVAKESGQAAATIVWENIIKMYARMLPSSLARAVWVVSPETFPELATMALSVGTGGGPIWLNNGVDGPPMMILGRPVIVSEKVPTLGTQGDISFVDFGYYLIGDRMAMSAMTSPHYKFGQDVTSYRVIERVDGRPWLQSAITPANGSSNTLSAFVQLATRA
jgi:HK97 family phage major capsid protein